MFHCAKIGATNGTKNDTKNCTKDGAINCTKVDAKNGAKELKEDRRDGARNSAENTKNVFSTFYL